MGTWTTDPYHDAWEGYMQMERIQLAERASGKMRRAIGRVLAGESREELERIADDDERLARARLVRLKERGGGGYYYKRVDDLTPADCWARIWSERDHVAWLKGRIEAEKIVGRWRENAQDGPRANREEADGDKGRHDDDGSEVEEGH